MSKRISKSFALNAADLFAPWVPVTEQNALKQSPLYLPFLKLYSRTKLICVEVGRSSDNNDPQISVHLGLPNNLRVAYLSMHGSNKFRIGVYDAPDSPVRHSTHLGTSEKCMYLVNRMLDASTSAGATFDKMNAMAHNYHNHIANNMGRMVTSYLRERLSDSYSVMSDINGEAITWLIQRYYNDVAEADIPSRIRDSITKAYTSMKSVISNRASNTTALSEFFDREKWMIGYHDDIGYYLGAGHFKQTFDNYSKIDSIYSISMETNGCNLTMPFEYYRTFNDIPQDIRKSLLASIAMIKMYVEGGSQRVDYVDPERLIPRRATNLIDANSCLDTVRGFSAYWMLVDRI